MNKLIIALAILILTAGVCSADNWVGGIPPITVKEGEVSGGVYFDSYYGLGDQPIGIPRTIEKTFTLPSFTNVEWAMLADPSAQPVDAVVKNGTFTGVGMEAGQTPIQTPTAAAASPSREPGMPAPGAVFAGLTLLAV